MHRGYSVPGVVTGKPIAIGGSVGRADATGQGVVYTIADAARRGGFELAGSRVAVQGFGNVGEATARLLHEAGAQRRRDHRRSWWRRNDREGLDVPFLRRHLGEHGTIAGAPGTRSIDNEELFGLDVDVLVLAALEGQITADKRRHRPGADPRRGGERAGDRPTLIRSFAGTASSSSRTSCATPAGSSSATSNGPRTERHSRGPSRRSTSACAGRSWRPPTQSGLERAPMRSIHAWPPRRSRWSVSPKRRDSAGSTRRQSIGSRALACS